MRRLVALLAGTIAAIGLGSEISVSLVAAGVSVIWRLEDLVGSTAPSWIPWAVAGGLIGVFIVEISRRSRSRATGGTAARREGSR
jgi:hypothetical protein